MNRREFLTFIGAGAISFSFGNFCKGKTTPKKPNILLIMADDMGFSDVGCYGGEISTPNLDSLAKDGLRFNQFYNCARCCPTRASILTGLYPHQAGIGQMDHWRGSEKGPYQGYLNNKCMTIAEVLKPAGYKCYMSGKWHVGEFPEAWPEKRGFDKFYGLASGTMNYFDIKKARTKDIDRVFVENDRRITPPSKDFYSTDAFTDKAINMLNDHNSDEPFFLYLPYTAPHWPLHAWERDIAKYQGRYMSGWDKLRKKRYEKQLKLGIIDSTWKLSASDSGVAKWDELDEAKKKEMDRKMAVYAAQIDNMDQNIGRILQTLKKNGKFENTLILFLSDNGACHESGPFGVNFRRDLKGKIGTADSYHSYGQSWANASNTPLRLYKHWAHEGGFSTPLIAHWPEKISDRGQIRNQVGHIIDIMPTIIEAASAEYPQSYKNKKLTPLQGVSLIPAFENDTNKDRLLYWEHEHNNAIRQGDWKLVLDSENTNSWELYNIKQDRCETNNLITQKPKIAKQLKEKWFKWAKQCGVRLKIK
ncbi:MAG: arylsulfatase [Planctomycetes bacterium]|nr:arylsulfatase [Planctomycetota bacterium]